MKFSECFRIIKIPERWVENEILDSISLYTKMMCTIQGLEILPPAVESSIGTPR